MTNKNQNWQHRQETIRGLLAAETVRSQSELLSYLYKLGLPVTQSSVSRDLSDIRAFKVDGRYVTPEILNATTVGSSSSAARDVLTDVIDIKRAGPNLLVIHTPAGRASGVAIALDRAEWPEVVGTLAGDDTVFVATAGRHGQTRLQARLARTIVENPNVQAHRPRL